MVDIRVTGLVKSFDLEKKILNGLSFQVDSGERVGLLGKNGAGKTTLFRMLTGELEPDEGEIQLGAGRRVGLISQIPVYPAGYTVEDVLCSAFARMYRMKDEMDALALRMEQGASDETTLRRYGELNARFEGLGGWDTDTAVNKVAGGLSIPQAMRQRDFDCLSGGEKTRVNLGRLILEDTDILLLDEPTNHLDLQATEWLEEYLRKFRGTVVTISHDRYFLDRTVTRIIEIQDGKAEFYSGNYSFYAIEKERRYQERMKQYLKEQAKIQQLEKAAEQMHLWAFMGNDALHKRAFSMEKRIERMRTTEKPTKARKLEARFQSREFKGDEVLQIKGLTKSFGEKHLFSDVYLRCEGGERIALLGENGTGKTTLLNILTGSEKPDSGSVRLGPSVKAAYLPQVIHFDHPERSILDTMLYELDITPQSARNRLAAYQFTGEDVFKKVSVLSGGELSRLRLCMLMDESINLLILDEPTNHLDIDSREWLEEAVEAFDGTLLFVSHDRYFINRFATRVWELENGAVSDYPMGFTQYRQAKEEEHAAASAAAAVPAPPKKTGSRGNRAQQAAKKQLTICETAISRLEAELTRLDGEMEQAACDAERLNELYRQRQAVETELEREMTRWEELSLQAEEQEN
ncbi:MAG: ABC transporter ATP-binding protein [Clostridiales bacterium]|nr:ABC transporter ATP-binding protein [Clostridiales bacterium]